MTVTRPVNYAYPSNRTVHSTVPPKVNMIFCQRPRSTFVHCVTITYWINQKISPISIDVLELNATFADVEFNSLTGKSNCSRPSIYHFYFDCTTTSIVRSICTISNASPSRVINVSIVYFFNFSTNSVGVFRWINERTPGSVPIPMRMSSCSIVTNSSINLPRIKPAEI